MFPIEAPQLKERVMQILDLQFRDNVKKRTLLPDGNYKIITDEDAPINCQEIFRKEVIQKTKQLKRDAAKKQRVFIPKTHMET